MSTSTLMTRCPSCDSENRLPLERIGQKGRCGRCKEPLAASAFYSARPVEITEARFDAVTRGNSVPVLVDFWAEWCAPCRQLASILEQLAAELAPRLLIVKLNADAAALTTARFGVQAIPTLVLLRSGIEVERVTGLLPLAALRERIARFL